MGRFRRTELQRRVGQRIAEARRARGLTQEALSLRLKQDPRALQHIEAGEQNLTLQSLEKIARALALPVDELLGASLGSAPMLRATDDTRPRIVPVVDLAAAAGVLRDERSVRCIGYTVVDDFGSERGFVARVEGRSMEPTVPAGHFSLFRAPPRDLERGRVLLLQHRARGAPDEGGSYLLKRVARIEHKKGVVRVELVGDNKRSRPVVVEIRDDDQLIAIAEWVRTL